MESLPKQFSASSEGQEIEELKLTDFHLTAAKTFQRSPVMLNPSLSFLKSKPESFQSD